MSLKKGYSEVELRFYQELNDFLPRKYRQKGFFFSFFGRPMIKDVIESLGIPHTEVDLLIVNGVSVDFTYHLKAGDRVAIYPSFESLDITPLLRLRPKPLRRIKFIADVHLKRLAKYLRLLGFDTLYDNRLTDEKIIGIALKEKRIILTRDLGILKNGKVTHGYFVRHTQPKEQVVEVACRFDLKEKFVPFSRCLECNGILEKVEKKEIEERLLPETKTVFKKFYRCSRCGQVYWEGSHFDKMTTFVKRILSMVSCLS